MIDDSCPKCGSVCTFNTYGDGSEYTCDTCGNKWPKPRKAVTTHDWQPIATLPEKGETGDMVAVIYRNRGDFTDTGPYAFEWDGARWYGVDQAITSIEGIRQNCTHWLHEGEATNDSQ